MDSHLDDAVEQARQLLEKSLQSDATPTGGQDTVITVHSAGNVAREIHIDQQTQHIGEK